MGFEAPKKQTSTNSLGFGELKIMDYVHYHNHNQNRKIAGLETPSVCWKPRWDVER